MRKIATALAAGLLFSTLGFATPKEQTYSGEIMDSQCAAMGSHAQMLKKEGMADKDPNDPMAKKMCTESCVKMGGKYVLYDAAHKKVYELDDQTKPAQFAGQKVKVRGSYDKSKKSLHVTDITAAS